VLDYLGLVGFVDVGFAFLSSTHEW